jgi:hypothetical protein
MRQSARIERGLRPLPNGGAQLGDGSSVRGHDARASGFGFAWFLLSARRESARARSSCEARPRVGRSALRAWASFAMGLL